VTRAYFDSSALVKLVREEAESQALIDYIDQDELEASTSAVAHVEVVRTLRRCGFDDAEALRGFYLVQLDAEIQQEAANLPSRSLRALDAIHIATALATGGRNLQFVTYDDRQAEAARAAGLKVIQPGRSH
jgi:predicted nucleic acid-binding protein